MAKIMKILSTNYSLHQFAANEYGCTAYGETTGYNSCTSSSSASGSSSLGLTGVQIGIISVVCLVILVGSVLLIRRILKKAPSYKHPDHQK